MIRPVTWDVEKCHICMHADCNCMLTIIPHDSRHRHHLTILTTARDHHQAYRQPNSHPITKQGSESYLGQKHRDLQHTTCFLQLCVSGFVQRLSRDREVVVGLQGGGVAHELGDANLVCDPAVTQIDLRLGPRSHQVCYLHNWRRVQPCQQREFMIVAGS